MFSAGSDGYSLEESKEFFPIPAIYSIGDIGACSISVISINCGTYNTIH